MPGDTDQHKDRISIKDHAGAPSLPNSFLYNVQAKMRVRIGRARTHSSVSCVVIVVILLFFCVCGGTRPFPVASFPIDFGQCCEVPEKKH